MWKWSIHFRFFLHDLTILSQQDDKWMENFHYRCVEVGVLSLARLCHTKYICIYYILYIFITKKKKKQKTIISITPAALVAVIVKR